MHITRTVILPVNKYNICFPVPCEFWPDDTEFATIDQSGLANFWHFEPVPVGTYWTTSEQPIPFRTVSVPEDYTQCIWKRQF